jgi:acetate---CoA ligase (ADP-forming)
MVEPEVQVVMLRDGHPAILREGRPEDLAALGIDVPGAQSAARYWVVAEAESASPVGIGGYSPSDTPGVADSRFTVLESHRGRGVGTLLLEQVMASAAEAGIDTLVSMVAEGDPAVEVLRASGAHLVEEERGGTIRIELSTRWELGDPDRLAEREQARTASSLRPFFHPETVAVIGASRSPASAAGQVFRRLVEADFAGAVYPVNPSAQSVAAVHAYPSILDVPARVDLAVVVVPAPAVLGVVEDCARAGVRAVVVISAGFSEVGEEGRARQDALLRLVREHGMRMVGPNCLGVLNTAADRRLNATFGRPLPGPGHLGMSSQSGAMGLVIVDYADQLGVGLSTFVSVGNKADVSGNDLLEYWERDPATTVVALYLESFGNPRRFSRIARRVARQKPILAVKSGRSSAGQRAAQSHTAALASSDAAADALFRQTGVIRLDTLEELFEAAAAFSHQPLPAGNRVAVVTNAGGPGILCADACEAAGLLLPGLGEATLEVLRAVLPAAAGLGNPIDMIATATPDQYEIVVQQVLQDPAIDAVIALNVSVGGGRAEAYMDAVVRGAHTARALLDAPKPVFSCFMAPGGPPTIARAAGEEGATIPTYRFPEAPARALGRLWQYRAWLDRPPGREVRPAGVDTEAARAIVRSARARAGVAGPASPGSTDSEAAGDATLWLTPDENAGLLQAAGISLPAFREVTSIEEAVQAAREIARPVAVKVVSSTIVHKTDVGGVALGLETPDEVRDVCTGMAERLGDAVEGYLVQEMVRDGTEVLLGIASDPTFGPLVAFGLGGTAVEVLRDVSFRVTPLTDADARDLLRSIRGYELLEAHRGRPAADREALEDLVLRLSWLTRTLPELHEMDLNPVRVFAEGEGLSVVDVRTAVRR